MMKIHQFQVFIYYNYLFHFNWHVKIPPRDIYYRFLYKIQISIIVVSLSPQYCVIFYILFFTISLSSLSLTNEDDDDANHPTLS